MQPINKQKKIFLFQAPGFIGTKKLKTLDNNCLYLGVLTGQQAGIWYSTGVGAGSPDVSGGISLFMAEYHGIEGATLSSYMGEGDAFSGSLGPIGSIYGLPVSLAGSYGRGFDASGVTSWSTYSGGLSIGNPNINWSSIRGKTYVLGGIINGSYQRTYSGLIWP